MSYEFEKLCTQFETQDPNKIITFDMEAFEIGISAHLSGYNIKELGWGNQNSILKVGFNFNNIGSYTIDVLNNDWVGSSIINGTPWESHITFF